MRITFQTPEEFGSFYSMLHFGIVLAANLHRDRTLVDVEREAALDESLLGISEIDRSCFTPAGTPLRQLYGGGSRFIEVDGDTLALVDKYVRYAAEKSAPDFARAALLAVQVVRRAAEAATP